ncbi:MAG: DUF4082 domain-containing protein [Planctomycetota bacterium]
MKKFAIACALFAGTASGQAVTSFSGGSPFPAWSGDGPGVVGWRFDVNTSIVLTDIGVWNNDAVVGFEGLTSSHEVGLWDSSGTLLTSGTVSPGDVAIGEFTYTDVADVVLNPGERYTIGAVYSIDDNDSYISSPTVLDLAPEINATTNGVFPEDTDLGGLFFPTGDSTNLARLGTNFLFIPTPSTAALLGLGGLAAARRRR